MKNKLYNVFFPIWFLVLIPITWIYALPINFIVDSAVVLITLKVMKVENIKNMYKKSIIWVFIFGFLSDIIGSLLLLITIFIPEESFFYRFIEAVSWNPFENVYSAIYVVFAIIVSAICIYFFNKKVSFRKLEIDEKTKKRLALMLAIFTAPYLFLVPTNLLYKTSNNMIDESYVEDLEENETTKQDNETIRQNSKLDNFVKEYSNTYLGDNKITGVFDKSSDFTEELLHVSKYVSEKSYSIDTENLMLVVNIHLDEKISKANTDTLQLVSSWAKRCSVITMSLSKNTEKVKINIISNNEIVKVEDISKTEINDTHKVDLDTITQNIEGFEELISSIK